MVADIVPCGIASLTCRQRHLKCIIPKTLFPDFDFRKFLICGFFIGDKTGIECLRCQRSGRRCIPAPVKPEEITFRHGQNPSLRAKGPPRYGESDVAFPDDQTWVQTPAEGPSYALNSSLCRKPWVPSSVLTCLELNQQSPSKTRQIVQPQITTF